MAATHPRRFRTVETHTIIPRVLPPKG